MFESLRRKVAPTLRLWFGLSEPIDRRTYLTRGLALAAVKYAGDAALVWLAVGRFWSPLSYLDPFTTRFHQFPNSLMWMLGAWTIPFLWIGVTMTMRRAIDAGRSAWLYLLFFVPVVNYALMLVLSALPSRPPPTVLASDPAVSAPVIRVARAAAAGAAVGLAMLVASVFLLKSYGIALFFGAPFALGAVTAYLFNRGQTRSLVATDQVVMLSLSLLAGGILLFALEGAVCLAMVLPIALVTAMLGALLGRRLAVRSSSASPYAMVGVLLLPGGIAAVETVREAPRMREVVSVIEVDAPPATVWRHVVSFSALPEPAGASRWLFRLGIAYPRRATIVGSGVGAVRYCEFSTGAFVEPITRWEAPTRLSFDVASQPPPLQEWSPYRRVLAPHLDGYFRSRRGEFRLTGLPGGRTRLEGSTWYTIDIHPVWYWRFSADFIVRRIHGRVLSHVKVLAEAER